MLIHAENYIQSWVCDRFEVGEAEGQVLKPAPKWKAHKEIK